MTRKTRTDAARNRQRIVEAARAVFAGEGPEPPTHEIARRAGVGVATVYRHFPSRPDLLHAVLAAQVDACAAEMRGALADPDPWRGLCTAVRAFSGHQIRDRALNDVLLGAHPAARPFADRRRAQSAALARLVERAHTAGALRPGVSVEDVRVGLLALSSLRALPPARAAAAAGRLTDLLLAGLAR